MNRWIEVKELKGKGKKKKRRVPLIATRSVPASTRVRDRLERRDSSYSSYLCFCDCLLRKRETNRYESHSYEECEETRLRKGGRNDDDGEEDEEVRWQGGLRRHEGDWTA